MEVEEGQKSWSLLDLTASFRGERGGETQLQNRPCPDLNSYPRSSIPSQVYDTQLKGEPKPMLVMEKILSEQGPYLGGEVFGVSDVAVASYLLFVPQFFPRIDLAKWPAISAYMLRCAQVCKFQICGFLVFAA